MMKSKNVRVLFIGNSFTQRNDLPGMLAEMAAARGITLEHALVTAGGASLRRHWNGEDAAAAIESGGYDFVVLQEQSTLPVKNAGRMAENVRLFAELVRDCGAKLVLYMTWARRDAPQAQQAIAAAYRSIGAELGAMVVPVGEVWQRFLEAHAEPTLYDRDGSHPSPAGSYLAACVFLVTLLGENPLGIETGPKELDADTRRLVQEFVWRELGGPDAPSPLAPG